MSDYIPAARPVTGYRVFLIILGFFGVIIAANLTMLISATSTFGGLVVDNSYVASQTFDADRDAARSQPMHRWRVQATSLADTSLRLAITDGVGPVSGLSLTAEAHRPTHMRTLVRLEFIETDGVYVSDTSLAAGVWDLDLIEADGQRSTVRINLAGPRP